MEHFECFKKRSVLHRTRTHNHMKDGFHHHWAAGKPCLMLHIRPHREPCFTARFSTAHTICRNYYGQSMPLNNHLAVFHLNHNSQTLHARSFILWQNKKNTEIFGALSIKLSIQKCTPMSCVLSCVTLGGGLMDGCFNMTR